MFFTTLAYTVFAFMSFWLLYYWGQKQLFPTWKKERNKIYFIFYHKTMGILLFGLIPLVLAWWYLPEHLPRSCLTIQDPETIILWSLGLMALIWPLSKKMAQLKPTQAVYPQMRITYWAPSLFILNVIFWFLYIGAYEFLFRGLLFFSSIEVMALWQAILINVVIYSLLHIPKGKGEIIGALPFGIVLCLGTYFTGNFLFAFITHGFQAVCVEYFS
ncbi:MAG: hypothetical protein BRD49_02125, partial [Bacteroidetes bacterium SW_10_40_5]